MRLGCCLACTSCVFPKVHPSACRFWTQAAWTLAAKIFDLFLNIRPVYPQPRVGHFRRVVHKVGRLVRSENALSADLASMAVRPGKISSSKATMPQTWGVAKLVPVWMA